MSELRAVPRSPERPALGDLLHDPAQSVRVPSFGKRGVVAFRRRPLRSVELAFGQTPKEVLSRSFQNLRRTASTKKSMRMSWRFARTLRQAHVEGSPAGRVSDEWAWRSVGDAALDVLVRTAVSRGTVIAGKAH